MKIGILGAGFMGMVHYLSYAGIRGARVTAIADNNRRRRNGDWRDIQGNFGPRGRRMDLSHLERHADYLQLIDQADVDLVDICLPPPFHVDAAIAALRAGKSVFCEKPLALSARDAAKVVRVANQCGQILLVGHVLPFFPEYAHALKIVSSRRYGRLLGGHFKRVISEPSWLPHFFDPRLVGGPMLDLHVHDAHFIRMLYGMPRSVYASGRMRGDVVEYFTSQMMFHDPHLAVSATSGVIRQQGRPFLHGFEIHLERATLVFEAAVVDGRPETITPLTLLGPRGRVTHPARSKNDPLDAFAAEMKEVLRSVRRQQVSPLLSGELARDAIILCERQTQSVRSGRVVRLG